MEPRFNLLLLGDGEYYLEGYAAVMRLPPPTAHTSPGQLKVCTKSVFFEPRDRTEPVTRYPYESVQTLALTQDEDGEDAIEVVASQRVEIPSPVAPYTFCKSPVRPIFTVVHVDVGKLHGRMKRLHALWNQQCSSNQGRLYEHKIAGILEERQAASLGMTYAADIMESPIFETPALRITPFAANPGCLLLTQRAVYFQPLNHEPFPIEHFDFVEIQSMTRRRYQGRHTAIECFLAPPVGGVGAPSAASPRHPYTPRAVFFALESAEAAAAAYDLILGCRPLRDAPTILAEATAAWCEAVMSNFDYLMTLNYCADRSFNCLSQYPVLPWVVTQWSRALDLSDPTIYRDLAKPVGALNPARLAVYRSRLDHQSGARFLYGTHYSTPAYVVHYLLRTMPELMLKLQNGRFDEPGRLFNSIAESWHSVLHNPADVKELIPEFYDVAQGGAFLRNGRRIDFGTRQDGRPVGDVELPAWATDPEDFVRKHRQALESEHVSQHLHRWIDLVFGYNQRGQRALLADNLFHPVTYFEGDQIDGAAESSGRLSSLLTQLNEFGQCPTQLFTEPHPTKGRRLSQPV